MGRLVNMRNPLTGEPFSDRTLWYPIYDTVSQGTAITAGKAYTYFATVQSASKALNLTNMTQAGTLPLSWGMTVLKLGIEWNPDIAELDAEHYAKDVTFELSIDGTKVIEAPVSALPSGFGLTGLAAGTGTPSALMINNGPAAPQATEVITPPIEIIGGASIVGTMRHHAAITLGAAVLPRVYLWGFLDQAITN